MSMLKKIKELRLFTKRKGSLSDARNKGIEVAEGKYLTFIDSDD